MILITIQIVFKIYRTKLLKNRTGFNITIRRRKAHYNEDLRYRKHYCINSTAAQSSNRGIDTILIGVTLILMYSQFLYLSTFDSF